MQELKWKYGPGVAALLRVRGVNPEGLVDQILLEAQALAGDAASARGICEQMIRLIGNVAPGVRANTPPEVHSLLAMDLEPLLAEIPVHLQEEVLRFAAGGHEVAPLSDEACDAWCRQFERMREVRAARPMALVVEDDAVNGKFVARVLEGAGWGVERAGSAAEGAYKAARERYDFVFMDYQLPDGTGAEAAHAIRAGMGPSAGAYILGASVAEVRRECLAAGMDEYLPKPIDLNTLKNRALTVAAATAQWKASEAGGAGSQAQLRGLDEYRNRLTRILARLSTQ